MMKVTVCQIDPRKEHLDHYLARLAEHVNSEKSDFLLLPEMGFSEWLAADRTPDPKRWAEAVSCHDHYIERLSTLGAKAVMGTRPIINAAGSRRNQAFTVTRPSLRRTPANGRSKRSSRRWSSSARSIMRSRRGPTAEHRTTSSQV